MDDALWLVREWLAKAGEDVTAAARLLADPPLPAACCFHAQQAAEKAIKALFVLAGVDAPRTHDLPDLVHRLLPDCPALEQVLADCRALTGYGVTPRYPSAAPSPDAAEAAQALAAARRVVAAVLGSLPPEVSP